MSLAGDGVIAQSVAGAERLIRQGVGGVECVVVRLEKLSREGRAGKGGSGGSKHEEEMWRRG